MKKISNSVYYIGVDDKNIDLFESQYDVPNGMCYNSYIIKDEKIVIMDTVDQAKSDEWLNIVKSELGELKPDYLVVSHMEGDHSGCIDILLEEFPEMKIIGNTKTLQMFEQFFELDISSRKIEVKEGEELSIGKGSLSFYMAPMVHWPEVMFTYYNEDKVLFSADGFGKFGDSEADEDWIDEARRYYYNICGKYGMQVQAILKKVSGLDIKAICPLHGPVLNDNLGYYIDLYDKWSKYEAEDDGILIPYCSIHGNTEEAAIAMADLLLNRGKKVTLRDLSRCDMSEVVSEAFKFSKMILICVTYNMSLFPAMNQFLTSLKEKGYQNRTVGIVQNGSWAPNSGNIMRKYLEEMKNITIIDPTVTIKSRLNDSSLDELIKLANNICE